MEFLIAIVAVVVFPIVIGWLYGRDQEEPRIDPDFYYQWRN